MVGCISRDTIRRRAARLLFVVSTAAFIYCTAVVVPYTALEANRLGLVRPDHDAVPKLGGLRNHVGELEILVDEAVVVAATACLLAFVSSILGERVGFVYLIASMLLFAIIFVMGVSLTD